MGVPESHRIEELLRDRLTAAFASAGWKVENQPSGALAPDLLVSKNGIRYAVMFRASPVARRQLLRALLADAILRARAIARDRRGAGVRPLAVIGAPTLTPAMVESLREYRRVVAPGEPCGWIDTTGRLELLGEGLEDVRHSRRVPGPAVRNPSGRVVHDRFTDLNQWLLKVLLAPGFPEDLLNAPRVPIRNASSLASVAEVSVPSAARFVSTLDAEHHLARDHALHITRQGALLRDWRLAVRRSAVEMPMRWILRPADPQRRLAEIVRIPAERLERRVTLEEREGFVRRSVQWERGPKMCLALFSACDALGLGIVRGVPRHIYMDPLDPELLRGFGLAPAEGADRIDVVVRRPRFPETVFRGAVPIDRVPVSDVIQAWLDVVDHPARGSEQAKHLWNRAILPHIERDDVQ